MLSSTDTDHHNNNISPTANQLIFSTSQRLEHTRHSIGKHHLHSLAHAASAPNTGTEQLHISVPLTGPLGTKRGEPSALHTDGWKCNSFCLRIQLPGIFRYNVYVRTRPVQRWAVPSFPLKMGILKWAWMF